MGLIVDLKMIGLTGTAPSWTANQMPDVTQYSGLDGGSGASWFIPGLQPVTPTGSTPPASGPAASPSGATGP